MKEADCVFLHGPTGACTGLALGSQARSEHLSGIVPLQAEFGIEPNSTEATLERFRVRRCDPSSRRIYFRTWDTKVGPVAVFGVHDFSPAYWRGRAVKAGRGRTGACGAAWSDVGMVVWAAGASAADLTAVYELVRDGHAISTDGELGSLIIEESGGSLERGLVIAELASLSPLARARIEEKLEQEVAQVSAVAALKLPPGARIKRDPKHCGRMQRQSFWVCAGKEQARLDTLFTDEDTISFRILGFGHDDWTEVTPDELVAACARACGAQKPEVPTTPVPMARKVHPQLTVPTRLCLGHGPNTASAARAFLAPIYGTGPVALKFVGKRGQALSLDPDTLLLTTTLSPSVRGQARIQAGFALHLGADIKGRDAAYLAGHNFFSALCDLGLGRSRTQEEDELRERFVSTAAEAVAKEIRRSWKSIAKQLAALGLPHPATPNLFRRAVVLLDIHHLVRSRPDPLRAAVISDGDIGSDYGLSFVAYWPQRNKIAYVCTSGGHYGAAPTEMLIENIFAHEMDSQWAAIESVANSEDLEADVATFSHAVAVIEQVWQAITGKGRRDYLRRRLAGAKAPKPFLVNLDICAHVAVNPVFETVQHEGRVYYTLRADLVLPPGYSGRLVMMISAGNDDVNQDHGRWLRIGLPFRRVAAGVELTFPRICGPMPDMLVGTVITGPDGAPHYVGFLSPEDANRSIDDALFYLRSELGQGDLTTEPEEVDHYGHYEWSAPLPQRKEGEPEDPRVAGWRYLPEAAFAEQ